jgi:hypothetical protein
MDYHRFCRNVNESLCFRDYGYLCICNQDRRRATCFLYAEELDQCAHCFGDARCITNDPKQTNVFYCICPYCFSGARCQFSLNSFEMTFDTLLHQDLTSSYKHTFAAFLIALSLLAFLIALPSNLFAFVTFRQPQCLRIGISHYLLALSVINQLAMAFFCIRLIHLTILKTKPEWAQHLASLSCGLISYCLENGIFISYWFASIVSFERVFTILNPTDRSRERPRFARRLLFTMIGFVLLSSNVHRIFFFKKFVDDEKQGISSCIFSFTTGTRHRWIIGLDKAVTILHVFVPLAINLGCTVMVISIVVKSKIRLRLQHPRESNDRMLTYVYTTAYSSQSTDIRRRCNNARQPICHPTSW